METVLIKTIVFNKKFLSITWNTGSTASTDTPVPKHVQQINKLYNWHIFGRNIFDDLGRKKILNSLVCFSIVKNFSIRKNVFQKFK